MRLTYAPAPPHNGVRGILRPHTNTGNRALETLEHRLARRERIIRALFWVVSAVLHACLVLSIGFVTITLLQDKPGTRRLNVFMPVPAPPVAPAQPEPAARPNQQPKGEAADARKPAGEPARKLKVPAVPAGLAPRQVLAVPGREASKGEQGRGLYGNRFGEARQAALRRFGGDRATEAGLDAALHWLAVNQEKDGRWLPDPSPLTAGQLSPTSPALSGLAVLAFLAGGHTHEKGLYANNVLAALRYILAQQVDSGCLFANKSTSPNFTMYNHAICTLALAESYSLTKDKQLLNPLRKAVDYTVLTQQSEGGWDYVEEMTGRNDTSVTCWVLLSLMAAHNAGVRVPDAAWISAIMFLDRVSTADAVSYTIIDGKPSTENPKLLSLLAAVLVCKCLLGWDGNSRFVRAATVQLARRLPAAAHLGKSAPRNVKEFPYACWYYGTLAMFQVGGAHWNRWNAAMKEAVLGTQHKMGRDAGSWSPAGNDGKIGGRTYCTALCALSLGIYARYLPINELKTNLGYSACVLALRGADGKVRKDVAALLLSFGKASLPALLDVLPEIQDKATVEGIMTHILMYADKPHEAILKVLKQRPGLPSDEMLTALMTLGESAVEGIVAIWPRLPDKGRLKVSATRWLGNYANRKEARQVLVDELDSPNDFVKLEAVGALLGTDNTDARAAASGLLKSPNAFVRMQAVRILPNQYSKWAATVLLAALEDDSIAVRRVGYEKLVKMVGKLSYDPSASAADRKAQVDQLRKSLEARQTQAPLTKKL